MTSAGACGWNGSGNLPPSNARSTGQLKVVWLNQVAFATACSKAKTQAQLGLRLTAQLAKVAWARAAASYMSLGGCAAVRCIVHPSLVEHHWAREIRLVPTVATTKHTETYWQGSKTLELLVVSYVSSESWWILCVFLCFSFCIFCGFLLFFDKCRWTLKSTHVKTASAAAITSGPWRRGEITFNRLCRPHMTI